PEVIENAFELAERVETAAEGKADIDRFLERRTLLGQMRERVDGALQRGDGFAVRRAPRRLGSGLPAVAHGFPPGFASSRMRREPIDVLCEPVRVQLFDALDDPHMQGASPIAEQS